MRPRRHVSNMTSTRPAVWPASPTNTTVGPAPVRAVTATARCSAGPARTGTSRPLKKSQLAPCGVGKRLKMRGAASAGYEQTPLFRRFPPTMDGNANSLLGILINCNEPQTLSISFIERFLLLLGKFSLFQQSHFLDFPKITCSDFVEINSVR